MPALQTFSSDNFTVMPHNTTLPGYPIGTWRSTTYHGSGRYWFEINSPSPIPLVQQLVGLVNASAPISVVTYQIGGAGSDSVGLGAPFLATGGLWLNATVHAFPPFTMRKFVNIAVNFDIMKIWIL